MKFKIAQMLMDYYDIEEEESMLMAQDILNLIKQEA
tara:strand:- start:3306 stop:3413 length:108 start_codon:yes stop_codon:yes gene_type:complete